MPVLYYFHDPMCSWCYAFDDVLKQMETSLPHSISLRKILGGLAADSTEPMPESLIKSIQSNWRRIEKTVPHIRFNFQFWENNQAIRSTYPACRAVLAANKQAPVFADKMIQQIQYAYYKNAENPSLNETLINCAKQIGLDGQWFKSQYQSPLIESELQEQIQLTQLMEVSSFPSLRLQINEQVLAIRIDYNDAETMLEQIQQLRGGHHGIGNAS